MVVIQFGFKVKGKPSRGLQARVGGGTSAAGVSATWPGWRCSATLMVMGGVVRYRLRCQLCHRWRGLLGLSVLVAVLGGVVLAAAAGATRTASAYGRLLAETNPPELLVSPSGEGTDTTPFYAAVASIDGVRGLRLSAGMPLVPEIGTPSERLADAMSGGAVLAPIPGSGGADIGRPHLVAGRLPDPQRADELLLSERFASQTGMTVGDRIDAVLLSGSDTDALTAARAADGEPIQLTVTGIGVMFDEVVPYSGLSEQGTGIGTTALAARSEPVDWHFEGAYVDVEPGAGLDGLTAQIEALGQREELGAGGFVFVADQAALVRQVDGAMRPLWIALAIAAFAVGLVALLVVGQAVSRSSREPPLEVEALQAIGSRPRDRAAVTLVRAAVVGVAGATGAIVIAAALSGLFPIGVARTAEPDPGWRVDVLILAIGAVVIVVLTVLGAVPAAVRRSDRRDRSPGPSRLATLAAAGGLSPAAIQGVRFAARGAGSRPIPMRSTLVAMTVAIVAVLATTVFAASLVALLDIPSRYGQGWDRMIDAQFGPAPVTRILDRLGGDPVVAGLAAGNYGDVAVNDVPVAAFDLLVLDGDVSIGIVEGRAARASDEIVLGGETMDRIGAAVGDTVEVDTGEGGRPMRVTGRGVFPQMGQGSFSATGLGVGAQLGADSLTPFGDFEHVPPDYVLAGRRYNFVAIDARGPPSTLDAAIAELEAAAAADDAFVFARTEQPPTTIRDLERVRIVPVVMAGALALVAVAALVHLLITSVRERRRELALLGALGFSRRQLSATVSWQASVLALVAVLIGAPIGVALGRLVWRWFADAVGAAAPAETPWLWITLSIVATVVTANLIAAIPARSAARTRPAVVLREE